MFQKRITQVEVQSAWQEVENDIAAGLLILRGHSTNQLASHEYFYYVEASRDGKEWTTFIDRRTTGRDAPHDYVQLDAPAQARHLRITNVRSPAAGLFSLYDFRIFGSGQEIK